MKKLFSKLTSATLALVLGVGALGLPLNAASANDAVDETPVETVDPGTFHMAEGASVRAGSQEGKPAGIRFRVELGEDMVNTVQSAHDFGFLIFPHVYLETAVANVTGKTAASYHVKADQNGDGEVSDAEYSANTYGLYDYVEVKKSAIADWNWDNAIYVDDIDGKTYVNGVLGEVKAENVGLQFAAIAWYQTEANGAYTYATFNADSSRSIKYVAQKAYIKGDYSRKSLATSFTWLTQNDFEISSGKDLYDLSAAVQAAEEEAAKPAEEQNANTLMGDFEGINFKLTKTIAVINDYVAVPDNFKGTFDYGDYAILVVDNTEGEYAGRAFVSDDYNKTAKDNSATYLSGVKALSSKLVDAENTQFWVGSAYASKDCVESLAATREDAAQQADYYNYTGKATRYTVTKQGYMSIKTNGWHIPAPNHTATNKELSRYELEAMKEWYTSIEMYVYGEGSFKIGAFDVGVVRLPVAKSIKAGYWQKWTFTIDEMLQIGEQRVSANVGFIGSIIGDVYNGSSLLPFARLQPSVIGNTAVLYVGDCVFVK